LGPAAPRPSLPATIEVTDIQCRLDRLPAAVAALRCLVAKRPVAAFGDDMPTKNALAALADTLRAARYGVGAWSTAGLDLPGADLLVQSLAALVGAVNETTRCACLPLGGSDNSIGASQACLWQAGYPLRTAFARGVPEHDPERHDGERL